MGWCLNAPTTCLMLRGGVMLNNPQQRKALVLSLLMVMLAQSAYIEVYRGWKPAVELQEEETDVLRVDSPAVCSVPLHPAPAARKFTLTWSKVTTPTRAPPTVPKPALERQ